MVLPFGLNPVLSKDGSLSEVGVKAENNVGRDFEEAVASGETNGNRELQDALNEFYRLTQMASPFLKMFNFRGLAVNV